MGSMSLPLRGVRWTFFALCCGVLSWGAGGSQAKTPLLLDTGWMPGAKYGLFMHYQYRILLGSRQEPPYADETPAGWNALVDGFDVNGFGDQLVQGHVGWVIFCVDDATRGWQCAPNATFNNYTGYVPGERCSNRDLIGDLSAALHARGVNLICYWAGLTGWGTEPQVYQGMAGDLSNPNAPPSDEARKRRLEVLKEYCDRYGSGVDGWWFDGMDTGLYDGSTYNYDSINSIVRGPNPNAVIAFSWGAIQIGNVWGSSQGDLAPGVQDLAGGDTWADPPNGLTLDLTQFTPNTVPGDPRILWHGKMFCGNVYHGLGDGNEYTDQQLIDWVNACNSQGGVCTMDWPFIPTTGLLKDFGAAQLNRVAYAIWGPPPPPPAGYQINAGGGAVGTWSADAYFDTGGTSTTSSAIDLSGATNPAPQEVYQSERYGDFTYTLPNLDTTANYTVRLHFAEIYWTAVGQRVFNVSLNGTQVLTNYDIVLDAGGALAAVVKEFPAMADSNGNITISFSSVVDAAKVSGIEVIGPPTPKSASGPTPAAQGSGGSSKRGACGLLGVEMLIVLALLSSRRKMD